VPSLSKVAPDAGEKLERTEPLKSRAVLMRVVLLTAVGLGWFASLKLWMNSRAFPRLPIFDTFPALPAPLDALFFGALVLSLLLAFRFFRPAMVFFLAGTLFLYFGDQQRGQPWFYLYWVLLLTACLRDGPALATARVILAAVYVWAGVQKCSPDFYTLVVPYMIQPVANWLPPAGVTVAKWFVQMTPAVEIFIGLGLWVPRLRAAALITLIAVHATALLLLGPLGHKYNLVVWPWNLAMIALAFVLFWRADTTTTWPTLHSSRPAFLIALLVSLLPGLSYCGWWDSYFSFALYSGNIAKADFIITPGMAARLPKPLRPFAHSLHPDVIKANPTLAGLFVFDAQSWAQKEMGVPPIPEPRSFRSIGRYLAPFAEGPLDLQLIIQPRRGPPQILRAQDFK
jgi:hypothetical protein